jgi:hypothetical protein
MGELLGRLVGRALDKVPSGVAKLAGDALRRVVADRLREVAEELERGDVVSDEEIDKLKPLWDRIRELQER